MNGKQICVANVQYKKPTASDSKRNTGLLRYLTYRDGRYGHIHQEAGMERWHDHGLGATVGQVAQRCGDYQSQHVLAFTLVFNPNPELTAMVPLDQREQFVCELTEMALERFFEARGVEGGIEYAFVMHHRESENPQSPGLHDPHTHVILPGTYYDEGAGERAPLYFSRNKHVNHVELLHQTTEQTQRELLDRYVGRDWEQRYDALEAVREQQRAIVETAPHGTLSDDKARAWDAWIGERRTDDEHSAVGYYRHFPRDAKTEQTTFEPDELDLEFRPLVRGLLHEQAATVATWIGQSMKDYPEQSLAQTIAFLTDMNALSADERAVWIQEMAHDLARIHEPPAPEITNDIEPHDEPPARRYDIDFF